MKTWTILIQETVITNRRVTFDALTRDEALLLATNQAGRWFDEHSDLASRQKTVTPRDETLQEIR